VSRARDNNKQEPLFKVKNLTAKNERQASALDKIKTNDITFLVGEAGTGKSFLPVYMGLLALRDQKVNKIVLVRPAVEAGETLGFLPGNLSEKLDPYMQPLVDCIEDLVGVNTCHA
jgi:phosphate starvation-inducible PhoH-like protein